MRDGGTAMDAVFLFPAAAAPAATESSMHRRYLIAAAAEGMDQRRYACVKDGCIIVYPRMKSSCLPP